MNKKELKKKFEKAKEVVKAKADDAVCFYKLHRSDVNAAVAGFVGAIVSYTFITKKLSSKESDESDESDENDADVDLDKYYDCRRVFNIDGKEVAGLYQYLGKKDGAAVWLDPEDEEFKSLDEFFRNDRENMI